MMTNTHISVIQFLETRQQTERICQPLTLEDYAVQPIVDVSPPKWHLGHSSWFFEAFLLEPFASNYQTFDPDFAYLFNSYYEAAGRRLVRTERGNMTRPSVARIYDYRHHVTHGVEQFLSSGKVTEEAMSVLEIGIHHEMQHQELLLTDIKYILGHNPLLPAYDKTFKEDQDHGEPARWIGMEAGIYEIGHGQEGFCYDNEMGRHRVFLEDYQISGRLVTNEEFMDFIQDDGYNNHRYWHAEGIDWVRTQQISAPMYWHKKNGKWYRYTLSGLREVRPDAALSHISYYEAFAFASWKGLRLPTEFEWEAAQSRFEWGHRWEWTESAYLPYPNFKIAPGALGEYNGKFMVNQKVLRGASIATAAGHSRSTYRNFFHPHLRWQFTGLRLAR